MAKCFGHALRVGLRSWLIGYARAGECPVYQSETSRLALFHTTPRKLAFGFTEGMSMARPIWTGTISFGLLNIPIRLMTAERRVDLHFRMLDSRDQSPVRYERVNAETGDEVPWKDIVKAFEYDKGSYVVMEKEDFDKAAPESTESVDIEAFIDPAQIGPEYYEKPYYLVPNKKAEKGYVLLRDTLRQSGLAGLARVVIRTRQYLSLILPREDALILILVRFPQELVPAEEYDFPSAEQGSYRIST